MLFQILMQRRKEPFKVIQVRKILVIIIIQKGPNHNNSSKAGVELVSICSQNQKLC